ncbi:MAG: helix-turn-helix domain-containing protein [Deltaproteobacteria bacterium]
MDTTSNDFNRLEKKLDLLMTTVKKLKDGVPRWLSLSEASKYCPLSRQTLLRLVEKGDIYGRYTGGKWCVDRESIDVYFLAPSIEIAQFKRKVLTKT